MAKALPIYKINPHRPVEYNEKAIQKVIDTVGYVLADIKYDGVRGFFVVKNHIAYSGNLIDIVSREGIAIPSLEWISNYNPCLLVKDIQTHQQAFFTKGCVIDCEMMIKGVDFNTSSGILRSKWLKDDNVKYHLGVDTRTKKSDKVRFCLDPKFLELRVIAVLPLSLLDNALQPPEACNASILEFRRKAYTEFLASRGFLGMTWRNVERCYQTYIDPETGTTYQSLEITDLNQLKELFDEARANGHEGLIITDPTTEYERGKKAGRWKMKPRDTVDGKVIGLLWGTEGLANEGKVIGFQVLLEDGTVVDVTGLTQSQMKEFTTNCKAFNCNYYQGWYCEVDYMEKFPDGSLRHPNFKQWRGIEDAETIKS
ncbi:ATP-dependent DNA ligase [Providencia phage PSTRCR_120]|uniref:DNA ligase n=1 Tax=Providencia phage PSTRCR_120 TaxID=2800826 RepID=A0A7T6ZLU9_9CAUD|nr:ATP-dependent DNA ligase [Providencia phage PSTRCR_120]